MDSTFMQSVILEFQNHFFLAVLEICACLYYCNIAHYIKIIVCIIISSTVLLIFWSRVMIRHGLGW